MRGYYLSPLVDSCFDLLMLRESVDDPADYSFYVNQTRDKLEQRRDIREQLQQEEQQQQPRSLGGGGGNRGGQRVAASGALVVAAAADPAGKKDDWKDAAEGRAKLEAPLKKGAVGE